MSWSKMARKDFEDVIQSRLIWASVGLFVLLMVIIGIGVQSVDEPVFEDFIDLFAQLGGWLMLPLIAIMIGYMAIVGERQSGSLRVLFGLTFSRGEVLIGKLASRVSVMVVVTIISLVVGLVVATAVTGGIDVQLFLAFSGLTILLAAMFTSIAISASALTSTRYRSMGLAVGAYILFALLWHPIAAGIHYVIEGSLPPYEAPGWYFLLTRLNPLEAFNQVTSGLIDQYVWGLIGWVNVVEDIDVDFTDPDVLLLQDRITGDLPLYLTDGAAALILALWTIVPIGIAYWSFNRVDLN